PLEGESDPWPDGTEDDDFVARLRKILNLNVDLSDEAVVPSDLADNPFYEVPAVDDPILVPPSYGLHHAMIKKLGLGTNPQWIEQLNLNPTLRAAAGLGTKTVQDKQEDLMHRAWQQVGEVNDANQKIREAELAKMVSRSLFSKHIMAATNDKGLARTAAFHRVILNSDRSRSVESQFAETRIPLAAKSAAFKRILRPGKKANKKINQMSLEGKILQKNLLQNFNKEEGTADVVMAAPLKIIPDNALSIGSLNTAIDTAISSYTEDDNNMAQETFFRTIRQADLNTLNRATLRNTMNALTDPSPSAAVKTITDGLITAIINSSYSKNAASGFIEMEIDAVVYKAVFGVASTVKFYENVKVARPLETDENEQIASATSSKDLQEFKSDFTDFSTGAGQLKTPELLPLIQNLGNFYSNITHKINPVFTIDRKITRRIKVWDGQKLVPLPKLKPILAHPEFPEPVYEYLGKISQNFILPNIDQLPNNSLTLLISNQKFIEAYMAGLNYEMARELLWREYPTDLRGSYFRQFWNIKDNIFDDDNSKLLDIKKVHEWRGALGTHSAREKAANLVLVVRGELLNKYPNTMVYAQTAVYDPADPSEARVLPETISPGNTKFPLFSAELEPDIMLFGFDLEADEAKGDRVPQGNTNTNGLNPGWFFVFKERPGQITFGLDDFTDDQGNEVMPGQNGTAVLPESWNDLAWEHLVDQREELDEFQISFKKNFTVVDPGDGNPHPSWGTNSADLASILFQNPVLFARHAAEMLP
ncbi:MAG: hypothetical protein KJN76_01565, partial [Eudoraea sp.]|nr:hypothetical protein [Eudoraea sp.]